MKKTPRIKQLLTPTRDALKALGGSGSIQEIKDKVIEQLSIPDEIVNIRYSEKGSQTQLDFRLGFARTALKDSGLLENTERGVWAIVPGRRDKPLDPDKAFERYHEKRKERKRERKARGPDGSETDDAIDEADEWREVLFEALTKKLNPDAFERLTKRMLRECGFIEVQVTGKPGDGGIDGIGIAKINDLMSFPVIFQCKRYRDSSVSAKHIRDFRGAMAGRTDKGLFITTSSFTRDARAEASRDGAPLIDLIDGEQLIDKLKELKLGITVEVEAVEKVTIDEDWYENI